MRVNFWAEVSRYRDSETEMLPSATGIVMFHCYTIVNPFPLPMCQPRSATLLVRGQRLEMLPQVSQRLTGAFADAVGAGLWMRWDERIISQATDAWAILQFTLHDNTAKTKVGFPYKSPQSLYTKNPPIGRSLYKNPQRLISFIKHPPDFIINLIQKVF